MVPISSHPPWLFYRLKRSMRFSHEMGQRCGLVPITFSSHFPPSSKTDFKNILVITWFPSSRLLGLVCWASNGYRYGGRDGKSLAFLQSRGNNRWKKHPIDQKDNPRKTLPSLSCDHHRIFVWGTISSVLLAQGGRTMTDERNRHHKVFHTSVWVSNISAFLLPLVLAIGL